jgi:hypothetical protein
VTYFSAREICIAGSFCVLGGMIHGLLLRTDLPVVISKKEDYQVNKIISNEVSKKEEKKDSKVTRKSSKTFYPNGSLKKEVIEEINYIAQSNLNLGLSVKEKEDYKLSLEEIKVTNYKPSFLIGASFNPVMSNNIVDVGSLEVVAGWRPLWDIWVFTSISPKDVAELRFESIRIGAFLLL